MGSMRTNIFILAMGLVVVAGCGGGDSGGNPDATRADGAPTTIDASANPDTNPAAECGNSITEAGEECDDGDTVPDAFCDGGCQFSCGNGVLDPSEICDIEIASGEGACPTECGDEDPCTADVLSGSMCTATCINSPITVNTDDDGCCLPDSTNVDDSDCPVECGNSVVEDGEICDTGIANGAGSCPLTCTDTIDCTREDFTGQGTCQAVCTHTNITQPINNDDCCPTGANSGNDNDCSASCGNGVVDTAQGETCDIAITAGAGRCPTTCPSDNVACTTDVVLSAGTCTAACVHTPITQPINGDGCCPTGANANNDNNCTPTCGNSVVESGETCDDGNNTPNDGCVACQTVVVVTAFRVTDLDLRDPHILVPVFGILCPDVTDTPFADFAVNSTIANSIGTDGDDADTFLDFSPLFAFRPLAQTGAPTPMDFWTANCTSPEPTTSCSPGTDPVIHMTATSQAAGTCLGEVAGSTVFDYSPSITTTSGPCFATNEQTLNINLSGIPIELTNARIAATYVGNPANGMVNGLLRGFISEAKANQIRLPDDLPLVNGQPLSLLLPGGQGNCAPVATHDDKDMLNGVSGWWFYLNFTARTVPWSE